MIDFRKLIATRFFFNLATSVQAVVVGWRTYELTHRPLALGLIGLTEAIPALGLAIFAGYIVDRSRPQRVYLGVILTSLVSALIVCLAQVLNLPVDTQIAALFTGSFITGLARGFSQPSMYAVVPRLMPRESLARAQAWMSTVMQTAGVLGPATGGLVFGWFGSATASALPVALLILASFFWLSIRARIPASPRAVGASGVRVRDELLSGARFVFNHPILLPALSLDMLSVLFGGVEALLPVYASEVLFTGPRGLGLLRAAPAIGAAMMAFLLTRVDIRPRAGRCLLGAVFGFGVCILIFGLSTSFALSLAALVLSGAFDNVSAVVRQTAVQLVSPDHLRGRISAVNSIFIGSSNELGEFESGVAAHFLGLVPAVTVGALLCLGVVTCVTFASPTLRRMHLGQLEQG